MITQTHSPSQQLSDWLSTFTATLDQSDFNSTIDLFADECFWRDLVSFTWNIKTAEGKSDIQAMLEATVPQAKPSHWQMEDTVDVFDDYISGWFTFETNVAQGRGHIRLKDGQCWTLFTSMTELKGFEEKKGYQRVPGTDHGAFKNRRSWLELKQEEEASLGYTQQPYCVIIGGGQGGIALAARLRRLEVPTIIVEKNERAGDSWRKRYKTLCLHDQIWQNHLPYLPFPDDWPVYIPKDKMGDLLESYTKIMELNYWISTECKGASYDEATETWHVIVEREGKQVTLQPKQLVLATGMSGKPNIPSFPGQDGFQGEIHHSSQHDGADGYSGKQCIVLGSNNSAHDICGALWENGADVTMVQRSPTMVVKSESLFAGSSYSEDSAQKGLSTHQIDMMGASMPNKLQAQRSMAHLTAIRQRDANFYARLEKAGFLLDFSEDGASLGIKYMRRGSGYYIDVGASDLIADGEIKLRSGVNIAEITETGVILTDGRELPADLIVLATGYGSMNGWAAKLISQEVADTVGKVWGLGSDTKYDPGPWEGEARNMWKPTQQPGLWFQGGNLQQARFYSIAMALQIKARMEGLPTPVYELAEVYHLH
ncbi:MAG: NAD(P)/FAD-dependent oxidoreductase [Chloroflexota bacterium]